MSLDFDFDKVRFLAHAPAGLPASRTPNLLTAIGVTLVPQWGIRG